MTIRNFTQWLYASAAVCSGLLSLAGCRGNPSTEPPVHWQRQMMTQDKGKAQRENDFFEDHRSMRPIVEGTVSTRAPLEVGAFYTGKDENGYLTKWPTELPVDEATLKRGQDRYKIYCTPCHDGTGSGHGTVIERANKLVRWQPTSYYDERILNMPVGQIFETITNGVRTMPAYAYQVPVRDRWAIVTYVRALQRSQHAALADVPESQRNNLK